MPKFKEISKNIQQVIIDNPITIKEKLTWTNISNAGKTEIEYLRKKYKFDLRHLQSSSGMVSSQRPIVQRADGYTFLILHFPVLKDGHIIAAEIDFFIKQGHLITIHNNENPILNEFFKFAKKDGSSLLSYKSESASILLYELLERLVDNCNNLLDQNSIKLLEVEEIIFSQKQKQAVSQILKLRRNIINFRKIIQSHKSVFKKLSESKSTLVPVSEMKKRYNILIDHTKRIWEILENQKEMISVLNETNETLLNYRLNDIMKTLTIFSVIVFPLTLLAAIFGMNTVDGMPFTDNQNGFWIVMSLMFAGCLGMLIFFKKKKWL